MNKNKLKSYAPAARRDFIQAVTDRAHFHGLSEKEIIPVEVSGDVAIIGGRPFPRAVAAQRKKLEERLKREGFYQVMEAVAYTWFNRFLALRYMELHGYLDHGFRVLSNTGSSIVPEILDHAVQLDLPGLNKQQVIELKLDGSMDAQLYRILLVAQCNALHAVMPFLFEKIEDETELLLPDNLLHSDSLIRKLVTEIDEEDWQEVEIIGWLYQFYILEKKAQVIGKVVKSEDIPAATQLFTPNWIVKYMVQNSLGRKWLATYPSSPLRGKMEYYIDSAEQTDEVKVHLAHITPNSLNPEDLTLLDPACGSGHILVEAYDVLKEMYLERGYGNRDFPRLILEKNLYGLDIDGRAAQMAGFALIMKARKDDRRILNNDNSAKLNVMAIQESTDVAVDSVYYGEHATLLRDLVGLFKEGKTFGSLIQVPKNLASELSALNEHLNEVIASGDLYSTQTANQLLLLIRQAIVLAGTYDCVVANPPYMGNKGMNEKLKTFAQTKYYIGKSDLFSMFIQKCAEFGKNDALVSLVTMQVFMFISSYTELRRYLIENKSIISLVHIGYNSFPEMNSKIAQAASFTFLNKHIENYAGKYIDLNSAAQCADKQSCFITRDKSKDYIVKIDEFCQIPGEPLAYWVSQKFRNVYSQSKSIGNYVSPRQGLITSDNERFLKYWSEVPVGKICFSSTTNMMRVGFKWFPYNKGGDFRKWYGNHEYVVNWENDGEEIKNFKDDNGKLKSRPQNIDSFFSTSLSWSDVTSGLNSFRYYPEGFIFDSTGPSIASNNENLLKLLLAFSNNLFVAKSVKILNPTLHFNTGDYKNLPYPDKLDFKVIESIATEAIAISKNDWDSQETSWNFQYFPFFSESLKCPTVADTWQNWNNHCKEQISRLQVFETENNRVFIEAYELFDELSPEVPEDEITLTRAECETDIKKLISYALGCMMGRYSLDQPGIVYANSENLGFDETQYQTFPADDDGIVPIMDMDWFPDDAASRFEEFLKVAWTPETLEENLKFVADSLSPKGGETPRETIRRYISSQFFKDHLQTYKKRPIYWLFSSGKQRAFECLVYLHRYNESTLSRMRNEYVTPLQGKFSAQVDYLSSEINAASSTAERNRLQKQLDTMRKKQTELASFDDLLRHYADQRISLDLDDGVKVNYGKFGALLAEVKAVTGGSE